MGEYCYVCEDTEPLTDPLEQRLQQLIHNSDAWGGLRRVLTDLQRALSVAVPGATGAAGPDGFMDLWRAVDKQVRNPLRAVRFGQPVSCSEG